MQNLIGTKVVHAAQSIHVDRDDTMVPTICGNWAAQGISPAWTEASVDCKGCIRGINAVHRKARILNDLVAEGVAHAEQMLTEYGEHNFNPTSTDAELVEMLKLQRDWLAADLAFAFENMAFATTRKSIFARATLVVLYRAEIAHREALAARVDPMVTENNYGEQGPFHFTEHPHDQLRAHRYDELCETLLAMVAKGKRPMPTSKQLVKAIIGLDFGEAIEEDRARFPHDSFTRLGTPYLLGHRRGDGITERVRVLGIDVSRRLYSQNMFMIERSHGMVQLVPEGDTVPNDSF